MNHTLNPTHTPVNYGIQTLSTRDIEHVAGGPIFIPVAVVKIAKFAGYATAAAGAGAALTVAADRVVRAVS
ncbi:hypothetical protein HME9302_00105 [Alteripontixanthobacter maritimus]|uniref:Uncharacterized protein n=1 Tax=Alteripontixanthobacter maritimus TaxID=2161824 RepID=A0A369Q7M6_9SPHN|nr:hypothetical protein [Alteripontixanthobacter maritimus]RDC58929.1 hypothetical protein HME9302_00105 [Alteripontixanthobacter maritimus]